MLRKFAVRMLNLQLRLGNYRSSVKIKITFCLCLTRMYVRWLRTVNLLLGIIKRASI